MTVPVAGSIPFAFALQNQGSGLTTTYKSDVASYEASYAPGDANFKLMPVISSTFGPIEDVGNFQREVDTSYHATGLFKRYYAAAGQVMMYPRLANNIGELLFATVGGVSSTNYNADGTHGHATIFQPPALATSFPWLTVRRYITADEDADKEGEEIRDCRITSGVFQFGAGGPMVASFGILGITPSWNSSFSAFPTNMTASTEAVTTSPVAMVGIGPILTEISGKGDLGVETATEQPVVSGQIAITNGYSGSRPDSELVVGSYSPDDMVLTSQDLSVSFQLKWKNPNLYRALMRGDTNTGGTWTPTVTRTALQVYLGSQDYCTGSIPYRLYFNATEVAWRLSPIALQGGGFLMATLSGVAVRQSNPYDTFNVVLENDVEYTGPAGYTGSW